MWPSNQSQRGKNIHWGKDSIFKCGVERTRELQVREWN